MNWSSEQKRAIELRDKNILVAAAAGSGKTAVLVERIKRLILEGECDIDQMLVVTFTNAAASEMKAKIEDAIQKAIAENKSEFLTRQIDKLPLANISTFHAFCLEVIRRYFYVIDIDPSFKICDNVQQELLKEQALDELLRQYFEESRPEFLEFLSKYSGERNESRFRGTVRRTYETILSLPEPFEWLESAASELNVSYSEFADGKICDIIFEDACGQLAAASVPIAELVAEAKAYKHDGISKIVGTYSQLASDLLTLAKNRDFDGLYGKLDGLRMPTLGKSYFKEDEAHTAAELDDWKDKIEDAREPLRTAVAYLKKNYFYDTLGNLYDGMISCAGDADFFLEVMRDYDEIFSGLKKKKGVVDFDDIQHFAFEILKDEEVSAFYREKFKYIFIDEYQDSNVLQEALIDRIKRENNVFMVGDVKQSIYKFRLAEPAIFQAKYRAYRDGRDVNSEKIDLNRNFRSKKSVIDFINRIFYRIMPGYDGDAALYMGDVNGERCNFAPKIFLAETPWDENSQLDDELKNMLKAEKEALAAVKLIKESLGQTIFDSKLQKERPLGKGDIVILMRAVRNYGDIFYKILSDNDLPAYIDDNDGYFDTMEINIFMSLLAVIDNEKQDLPLITVMRSEIFGFTIAELAEIRIAAGSECSYHDAVVTYAENGVDQALKDKCLQALSSIVQWRDMARMLPLEELVWQLMLDTGFYIAMGAMPAGSRRQANLRALCDKARAYEGDSLYAFLQYIEAVKQRKVSMGQVKMAAEGDDTIRIMTIHKSKGLEFPMVILSGICRHLNYTKKSREIAIHKDVGIGLPIVDSKNCVMKYGIIQNVIHAKVRAEEAEEEKRILYVAMTRAKDILYLLGITDDYAQAINAGYSDTSYLGMCLGAGILPIRIDNSELVALSQGRKRNIAQGLALLDEAAAPSVDLGGAARAAAPGPQWTQAGQGSAGPADLEASGAAASPEAEQDAAAAAAQEVARRMEFKYPHAADLQTKSKYAVSELASGYEEGERAEITLSEPASFKVGRKLTAAQIGSVTHKLLEKIDFAAAGAPNYVSELIDSMVTDEFLTKDEAAVIDIPKIEQFIASPLGQRMANATELRREQPFNLVLDAGTLAAAQAGTVAQKPARAPLPAGTAPEQPADSGQAAVALYPAKQPETENQAAGHLGTPPAAAPQSIIVQGIIDCYFEEPSGLVLVDYKTSQTRDKSKLAARYQLQIDLYRQALEAATGKPVKEAYLYLTNTGALITM